MKSRLRGSLAIGAAVALALGSLVVAQGNPPASPSGSSAAQVLGKYVPGARGLQQYQGGKWIEIKYGRPLKRGRDVFPAGADYAKMTHTDGAKVWRAGANVSTRLRTEVPLVIGGKTVPAGEYSLFIDVQSPSDWTFIVSTWPAQANYDPNNKEALWGSFGYTPDKDVARAPMRVSQIQISIEQLTWQFIDMTNTSGALEIVWDKTMASVPFKVGS